jgi:cellulose synthase/poly-beta-1,6-N-acetylglucosamine synthase-like glycosyltransferase
LEAGVHAPEDGRAQSQPDRARGAERPSPDRAAANLRLLKEDATLDRRLAEARALQQASDGLALKHPELSARTGLTESQRAGLKSLTMAALVSSLMAPEAVLAILAGGATIVFALAIVLRVAAALSALVAREAAPPPRRPDDQLSTITYLVALYKEANVAPALAANLMRLDYPPHLLDIKLLVEIDDDATIDALRMLALPPQFEIIPCPPAPPRTKPRALNIGLGQARGQIIAVLDAEDIPDPSQPRAADQAFATGPKDLAVVQAPLQAHNGRAGWIAQQFEIEYAVHFGVWLPFVARLRWPMALGGTSNYFRRKDLIDAGGWDAWNVTEDADLGLRLARRGKRAAMIAPPTLEEAPVKFRDWLNQRTRWKKGHLQSWLVLMRDPFATLGQMGAWGFLGAQLSLGGALLASLLHGPILLGLAVAAALGFGWPAAPYLALFGAGYGAVILCSLAARGGTGRFLASLMTPVYLPLISIAMLRALRDMKARPHFWAKTPHGVSK